MSDETNMPGVDKPAEAVAETAKFGQRALEVAKAGGEWASAVAGSLPHDIVGILGDTVRAYRIERAVLLRERMVKRLRDRGYENPEALNPSPSLLLPMLEAAVDEDRSELQELWEKLMAAASAPDRRSLVRQSFITTIKQLDPPDALILQAAPQWEGVYAWRDWITNNLVLDADEAAVSAARLKSLSLLEGDGMAMQGGEFQFSGYRLSAAARLLLKAVAD